MKDNIVFRLVLAILILAVLGFFTQRLSNGQLNLSLPTPKPTPVSKTLEVNGKLFKLEIVNTEELRVKGLSDRQSMPEDTGMLFDFGQKDVQPYFWMKNMLFPIDIIWIKNNVIVKINEDLQPPKKDTPDSRLVFYTPGQPIDYVLEINAGLTRKLNIQEGAKVKINF